MDCTVITYLYTLSLHDALPICTSSVRQTTRGQTSTSKAWTLTKTRSSPSNTKADPCALSNRPTEISANSSPSKAKALQSRSLPKPFPSFHSQTISSRGKHKNQGPNNPRLFLPMLVKLAFAPKNHTIHSVN